MSPPWVNKVIILSYLILSYHAVSLKLVIEGSQNHGAIEGIVRITCSDIECIVRITVLLKVVIEGSQNHGVIEGSR